MTESRGYLELLAVAKHVRTMADDAYLVGQPEWISIVEEAEAAIDKAEHGEMDSYLDAEENT